MTPTNTRGPPNSVQRAAVVSSLNPPPADSYGVALGGSVRALTLSPAKG